MNTYIYIDYIYIYDTVLTMLIVSIIIKNKSIIKKTYTIDSLFRQNYENTDNESHNYLIQLPETITKAITMSVSSIEIPFDSNIL